MPSDTTNPARRETAPPVPRRVFLASALSAIVVAGAVGLGLTGAATVPVTETFQFSRATSLANGEQDRLRGFLATALQDEVINVVILGHSGTQGDAEANLDLSVARADTIAAFAADLGIPEARITSKGLGGGRPLDQAEGVSDRAFQSQLARVEVTLQARR